MTPLLRITLLFAFIAQPLLSRSALPYSSFVK